jgi:hypothetical protein
MRAVHGVYQDGEVKLIEPVRDVESAPVLVIFPGPPEAKREKESPETDMEAELFGAGVDLWTDEVDAAVRESWKVRTRSAGMEPPWDAGSGENGDAAL